MASAPSSVIRQAAALPIRSGRVCLVLSSSGKRWVIPKGCIERSQSAPETALQEAWEEAGLIGVLRPQPVGSYVYKKCGHACHVTVFMLDVIQISQEWPESNRRVRQWFRPQRALARVSDRGLRKLMRGVLQPECLHRTDQADLPVSWQIVPPTPLLEGFLPLYGIPFQRRRRA